MPVDHVRAHEGPTSRWMATMVIRKLTRSGVETNHPGLASNPTEPLFLEIEGAANDLAAMEE